MDPLSISLAAATLIATCFSAVKILKSTIEMVKSARTVLQSLLQETERMRLLLEQMRALTGQLQGSDLVLGFDSDSCAATVASVLGFARKVAANRAAAVRSMMWLLEDKGHATALVHALWRHESEIITALSVISASSNLKMAPKIQEMYEKSKTQAAIGTPFPDRTTQAGARETDISPVESSAEPMPEAAPPLVTPARELEAWHGETLENQFNEEYIEHRLQLAVAAFSGNWQTMFNVLNVAKEFGENWVNCFKLKPSSEAGQNSGWAPLHQAAFMCAPIDVVEKLLEQGAFRTLRTLRTDAAEFEYLELTPLEIARALGYSHLYGILSPVIRHSIPFATLERLQARFHELINRDCGERVRTDHIRLPELVVLLEMEVPEMWFRIGVEENAVDYYYRLDNRELLVRRCGKPRPDNSQDYRISDRTILAVEEALIFNT